MTRDTLQGIVFTDLDGSLLDHRDYGCEAALPLLATLEQASIPVIFVTSKTRVEVDTLRTKLGNTHPFVVENGAAIVLPTQRFPTCPPGFTSFQDHWILESQVSRQNIIDILSSLTTRYPGEFISFSAAGTDGIASMTGLSSEAAALANTREYSEPIQWRGEPHRLALFIEELKSHHVFATQGGRFISLSGRCDKGLATRRLIRLYENTVGRKPLPTLSCGDSANDIGMLESTDTALCIRSPAHDFPPLSRNSASTIHSTHMGTLGWIEGVQQWCTQSNLILTEDFNNG